ncbi:MAG TPA: hypothetical protein VJK09_03410 [Candidatus Paceibacterota bacterium]
MEDNFDDAAYDFGTPHDTTSIGMHIQDGEEMILGGQKSYALAWLRKNQEKNQEA